MEEFDKPDVNNVCPLDILQDKVIKRVEVILASEEMSSEKVKRASEALHLVATWAKAMIKQHAVLKMVEERMAKEDSTGEKKQAPEKKPVESKGGPKVVTGKTSIRSKRGKIVRSAIDTSKAKQAAK
jgi:hypothetical protein